MDRQSIERVAQAHPGKDARHEPGRTLVPLRLTRLADERRDFMAALVGAISLR